MNYLVIENVIWGKLTQGMIFPGAYAEDYVDCKVYGLIITARCDIAHDKVTRYNYFPIVQLTDWIMKDFCHIFLSNARKDALGTFKNILKEAGFSLTILDTEPLDRIYQILFEQASGKKLLQLRSRFEVTNKIFNDINAQSHIALLRVIDVYPKIKEKILDELVNNKLNGYYFLPSIEPDGEDNGYVVLLREINYLPKLLAKALASGLSGEDYITLSAQNTDLRDKLRLSKFDFCCPIGKLKSPNIEHLMQTFAYLFSRIGIEDISDDYARNLWERQPSTRKDIQ